MAPQPPKTGLPCEGSGHKQGQTCAWCGQASARLCCPQPGVPWEPPVFFQCRSFTRESEQDWPGVGNGVTDPVPLFKGPNPNSAAASCPPGSGHSACRRLVTATSLHRALDAGRTG